jgi:hypothetical protein
VTSFFAKSTLWCRLRRVDTIVQWIRPAARCLILGSKEDTMSFAKVLYTTKAGRAARGIPVSPLIMAGGPDSGQVTV